MTVFYIRRLFPPLPLLLRMYHFLWKPWFLSEAALLARHNTHSTIVYLQPNVMGRQSGGGVPSFSVVRIWSPRTSILELLEKLELLLEKLEHSTQHEEEEQKEGTMKRKKKKKDETSFCIKYKEIINNKKEREK